MLQEQLATNDKKILSFDDIIIGDVKEEDDDDEEDEEDDETSGERAYDQLAYCGGLLQMHLRSRAYLHQQYQRPSFQMDVR